MTHLSSNDADAHASQPSFGLHHDPWGRLALVDHKGRRYIGVEPVRAFPLSEPNCWISICDSEGHELLVIKDLDQVPPAARSVLQEELARREFMPIIERIIEARVDAEPSEWKVQTDRGPTRFLLSGDDGVRRLGPRRAMLFDVQGVRYLVPDMRKLDGASRRLLERYF